MLDKKNIKILLNKKYKITNLKKQIKFNLQKFILQNRNIIEKEKKCIHIYKFLNTYRIKNNLICQLTGRKKNIKKQFMMSRHELNRFVKNGYLSNIKIKSW